LILLLYFTGILHVLNSYVIPVQVSSWQVPSEVAEIRKNQENDSLKANTAQEESSTGIIAEEIYVPLNISTPAVHTGGRDSMVVRSSGGQGSSSALDLIKKKLQEAGTPVTATPLPPSTIPNTYELNGSKAVEAVAKGQQSINSKDKVKDANGEENMSDSSSDSEDAESGPTKEECIIQFKVILYCSKISDTTFMLKVLGHLKYLGFD